MRKILLVVLLLALLVIPSCASNKWRHAFLGIEDKPGINLPDFFI